VDLILLDWTRMGKCFCLAGVVVDGPRLYVVRPLPVAQRGVAAQFLGWPADRCDGFQRWQVIEMVEPEPAGAKPPHVEDAWVRELRPHDRFAPAELRRAILTATALNNEPLFGTALHASRATAFANPGTGQYSLTTVTVPAQDISFRGMRREGSGEVRLRVTLPVRQLGQRTLPVTDHPLLTRAATVAPEPERQAEWLTATVRGLGETVAVRLGLSRPYFWPDANPEPQCWLMADGFFALADPR
jgi:hypothetical protein